MSWLSAVLMRPPFSVKPAAFSSGAEVAEREVAGFAAVAGVGAAEAERPHDEPQRPIGRRRRRPRDVPPEGAPERRVGEAADGVHHLQVEAAVGRRRRQAAREEQVRIVEVERLRADWSSSGAPRLLTAKSDPIGPGSSFSYGTSTVATPPMRSDTDGSSV